MELTLLGSKSGQQGTLCIQKYRCDYVLLPLLSTVHMAMNADLLVPGSNVFYLRGTTGERVPATVVGLSSFPECVAISYEHSSHTQIYRDCPVKRLTFPIVCAESPEPIRRTLWQKRPGCDTQIIKTAFWGTSTSGADMGTDQPAAHAVRCIIFCQLG